MTDDHVLEDAFMLSLQKRDYQGAMWVDGKKVDFRGSRQGNFTLYDYSRVWRADLQSPFDCTNFYISRRALYSLEEEIGTKPLEGFNVAPGADIDDPVVHNIVNALIPPLLAAYAARLRNARAATTVETLTIEPPSPLRISRAASVEQKNVPLRFVSIT